jgi:hypothetical protein
MLTLLKLYRSLPPEIRALVVDALQSVVSGDTSGAANKVAQAARRQRAALIAKAVSRL